MIEHTIKVSSLAEYLKINRLYRELQVRLHLAKEESVRHLETMNQIKNCAKHLSSLKMRFKDKQLVKDKEMDKMLRTIMNKSNNSVLLEFEKLYGGDAGSQKQD